MNTKIRKLKGHSEHLLQSYLAVRKQYEYLEPMVFSRKVADVFNGHEGADVFHNMRINLYYLCIQDLANLLGDRCSKTPSVENLMNELWDPAITRTLRDQVVSQARYSMHPPILKEALDREQKRKMIGFGVRMSRLNKSWELLSRAKHADSFKKVRDKITAHAELQFDRTTYNRFPIASLGLKWGDLKSALDNTEPIVLAIDRIIRGGGFDIGLWYRSIRQERKAFYDRWLLTPHAADGRCRHAACRARGAPAHRGSRRGRS